MPERSKDWMDQAERDLHVAEELLHDEVYEWSCFIAHQAAEKALKSVFQKFHAVAWGHSLLELLKALARRETVHDDLFQCARSLDKYYVPTRYPNGFESGSPYEYFTQEDAEHAIVYSRRIIEFCQDLLA